MTIAEDSRGRRWSYRDGKNRTVANHNTHSQNMVRIHMARLEPYSKRQYHQCCIAQPNLHQMKAADDTGLGRGWSYRDGRNRTVAKNCTRSQKTARVHMASCKKARNKKGGQNSIPQKFAWPQEVRAECHTSNAAGFQSAIHRTRYCPSKTRAREQPWSTPETCAWPGCHAAAPCAAAPGSRGRGVPDSGSHIPTPLQVGRPADCERERRRRRRRRPRERAARAFGSGSAFAKDSRD